MIKKSQSCPSCKRQVQDGDLDCRFCGQNIEQWPAQAPTVVSTPAADDRSEIETNKTPLVAHDPLPIPLKLAASLCRISALLIVGYFIFALAFLQTGIRSILFSFIQPWNTVSFAAAGLFYLSSTGITRRQKKAGIVALCLSGILAVNSVIFFSPMTIPGLALSVGIFLSTCAGFKWLK